MRKGSPVGFVVQQQQQHIGVESHREISWGAVLIFENFNPLITLCHAEEVALDVGLTLLDPDPENTF